MKIGFTKERDELLARILDAVARIKKHEDQLRRTTRDLRTRVALRLTVRFSNIYCKLYHICHLCVINLSFKH
jgi:hypothetical protein